LARHLRETPPRPRQTTGISILKPLCGVDDDLRLLLVRFAQLDHPDYELLLGVRSRADAAFPIAEWVAQRFPGRVRVILQRGEPGLNPKVNQLITLAAAARHEVLVVSDSNVAVDDDYLQGIAAYLEDSDVGLVTHPVAGTGEQRFGALLDNLHLSGSIGPGMVGAKRVAGKDIVVGKSMALRRSDLLQLGGFESVADLLAEDYVIGKRVSQRLGKRVVVAHRPVWNVSRRRSVSDFFARYRRWSVIHRKAVGLPVYLGQPLLNPVPIAIGAAALSPSTELCSAALAIVLLRVGLDAATGGLLRGRRFGARQIVATPAKDLLLAAAWLYGLWTSTVEWRSNRLEVLEGTRLARPQSPEAEPELARHAA
jgi:ceramide glucosyltransferase